MGGSEDTLSFPFQKSTALNSNISKIFLSSLIKKKKKDPLVQGNILKTCYFVLATLSCLLSFEVSKL